MSIILWKRGSLFWSSFFSPNFCESQLFLSSTQGPKSLIFSVDAFLIGRTSDLDVVPLLHSWSNLPPPAHLHTLLRNKSFKPPAFKRETKPSPDQKVGSFCAGYDSGGGRLTSHFKENRWSSNILFNEKGWMEAVSIRLGGLWGAIFGARSYLMFALGASCCFQFLGKMEGFWKRHGRISAWFFHRFI